MILMTILYGKSGKHEPSAYRALVREAKSGTGRKIHKLIVEAEQISDSYYKALALFELSNIPELKLNEAVDIARNALEQINLEDRLWRRAELLTTISKKTKSWRNVDTNSAPFREEFLDMILDIVLSMPNGQGLSDAISGCASRFYGSRFKPLLMKAVKNNGFILKDVRAIIHAWAKQFAGAEVSLDEIKEIQEMLKSVPDESLQAKLLGYLSLQCKRNGAGKLASEPLQAAVGIVKNIQDQKQLETLRYLAQNTDSQDELMIVFNGLENLKVPVDKANFLATLAGAADKGGFKKLAKDWFNRGLEHCDQIMDSEIREKTKLKLAQGLSRSGETKLVKQTNEEAKRESKRLVSHKPTNLEKNSSEKIKSENTNLDNKSGPNNILALFDTYEGGLKPVHFRSVARAAPVCYAFDLDLALMGFPTNDLEELVKSIIAETNIGHGGRFLEKLLAENRIFLVPCTTQEPPDFQQLGIPVATTSHPSEEKKARLAEIFKTVQNTHQSGRVCLIIGLGKKGLPPSMLTAAESHVEFTGKNIPLETCTAIGVAAQQLAEAQRITK
jgi:hypothetical protein